jgi:hypothetical protein
MSQEAFKPSAVGYAEVALDLAMSLVPLGARPWTVAQGDLDWLKQQFRTDFEREIGDVASYRKFEAPIQRLFHHVGTTAAFLAEARQQDVFGRAGTVSRDQLQMACKLVEHEICPRDVPPPRRRLCQAAVFLKDPKVKSDVEAFARSLLERLAAE